MVSNNGLLRKEHKTNVPESSNEPMVVDLTKEPLTYGQEKVVQEESKMEVEYPAQTDVQQSDVVPMEQEEQAVPSQHVVAISSKSANDPVSSDETVKSTMETDQPPAQDIVVPQAAARSR